MFKKKRHSRGRRFTLYFGVCAAAALLSVSFFLYLQWKEARRLSREAEAKFAEGNIGLSMELFVKANNKFGFDRSIIINSVDAALMTLEMSTDEKVKSALKTFVYGRLARLEAMSGRRDGMALLFRAWLMALQGNNLAAEAKLQTAMEDAPGDDNADRIASHVRGILRRGRGAGEQR